MQHYPNPTSPPLVPIKIDEFFRSDNSRPFLKFLEESGLDPATYLDFLSTAVLPYRYIRINKRLKPKELEESDYVTQICGSFDSVPNRVNWLPLEFDCYSLPIETHLHSSTAYRSRSVFGIDSASLYVVACLNIHPKSVVLDMCCAPGCKLFGIADQLEGKVVGLDIDQSRLRLCQKLAKSYKVENVILIQADATKFHPKDRSTFRFNDDIIRNQRKFARRNRGCKEQPEIKLDDQFDRILVDVECTHDGSIRHLKGNNLGGLFDKQRFERLEKFQLEALINAWKLLKEGGRLVYSTCSLCPKQNELLIEKFVEFLEGDYLSSTFSAGRCCPAELYDGGREPVPASVRRVKGLEEIADGKIYARQFSPEDGVSDGLFVCAIEKQQLEVKKKLG